MTASEWLVTYSGGGLASATDTWLSGYADIAEREFAAGILPRTPILTDPGGQLDARLVRFFRSAHWISLGTGSQATYAPVFRPFINFLSLDRGVDFTEVTPEDIAYWKRLRTDHSINPHGAVSGATWQKEVGALSLLYDWASADHVGLMKHSPFRDLPPSVRRGRRSSRRRLSLVEQRETGMRFQSKDIRSARSLWATPRTFLAYRAVGLEGRTLVPGSRPGKVRVAGHTGSARMRNVVRNVAFVDYVYQSGLRRNEAGGLLHVELPSAGASDTRDQFVPSALTKSGVTRIVQVSVAPYARIHEYVQGERADAIAAGQRENRYVGGGWIRVEGVRAAPRTGCEVRLGGNQDWRTTDALPVDVRLRLLEEGPSGLQPMALWLGEDGRPLPPETWSAIMRRAGHRYSAECERLGAQGMHLSPHSLRFSNALLILLNRHKLIDQALGGLPSTYDPDRYRAAYRYVAAQLGHASESVTRETYLGSVQDLLEAEFWRGSGQDLLAVVSERADELRSEGDS